MSTTFSWRDGTACAAPGCTNPVVRNPRGRPALYCSPACRSVAYRNHRHHRDHPLTVEVAPGSTSAKGRPAGRVWMVRLCRGERKVILAVGLGRPSAESLAQKIAELLGPRSQPEAGAIE